MATNHDRQYLCLSHDKYLRTIQSCICGTPIEIEFVLKKLIHSSKKLSDKNKIFWRVV